MKEWTGDLQQTNLYQLEHWYQPSQVLLFDIETTGFSPQNTLLYMIGFCYYQGQSWHYRMLFNDDGRSEYRILNEFLTVLQSYTTFIHFNGDSFDVPYLMEKCRQYRSWGLSLPTETLLSDKQSIDLYKIIKPYKNGLKLPNLKLTTIETAMQLHRTDSFHGGELIRVYQDFLTHPDKEKEELLYRHNYEDILAMIPMIQLLNFQELQKHHWELLEMIRKEQQIRLLLHFNYPLPLRYVTSTPYFDFNGYQEQAVIVIPIYKEEMRYFLSDWKNYYYLPLEETVIHKSVAAYVDTSYKEKAKKNNCFLKKEGCFLPFPKEMSKPQVRLYKRDFKDTLTYAELADIESDNPAFWLEYLKHTF